MFNKFTAWLKSLRYQALLAGPWFTLDTPKKEVVNTEDQFTINGTEYRAVNATLYPEWCKECAFVAGCSIPSRPSCVPMGRADGRNVIFVEVQK